MTILALDLARHYGWAVVDAAGQYVASGARELPTAPTSGAQMHMLSMSIADLIDEYAPEWVAIEKPIHTGKFTSFQTARNLYSYAAIAGMVAHIRELGFVEIGRSTCCKLVLGDGRAKKAAGVVFARQFKPLLNSDDEADAVLVAMAAHKLRHPEPVAPKSPTRKRAARPSASQIARMEANRCLPR